MEITPEERLNLKKMMTNLDYEDNTAAIRKLKHSVRIRDDIRCLERLKKEHSHLRATEPEQFFNIAYGECRFLFDNYIDIFTRTMKDEIDIMIMTKILIVLKLIEDEQFDQNEGSIMVGKYLKDLYLDSAVKHADNLDKGREVTARVVPVGEKKISWNEFKKTNL